MFSCFLSLVRFNIWYIKIFGFSGKYISLFVFLSKDIFISFRLDLIAIFHIGFVFYSIKYKTKEIVAILIVYQFC